jgi:orotidine-5'-phosphate decarboxylase
MNLNYNPIIVALDVHSAAEARALVSAIGDGCRFYKVGLELFTSAGPDLVRELVAGGNDVFVDLKMHDIGETVKRAAAQVARLGARLLTVHSSPQAIRAAKEGAAGSGLKIVAVTVLTSFDQGDLEAMGYRGWTVAGLVDEFVRRGVEAGADGFVCSPLEVARVKAFAGPGVTLVTPGVRSAGASKGDQKRVSTPAEAVRAGADYLVIGREITRAADPCSAARLILNGLDAA